MSKAPRQARRPAAQQKTVVTPSLKEESLGVQILAYVKSSPGATYQELATNFQCSVQHVRHVTGRLRHNRLVKFQRRAGRTEVHCIHPAVWRLSDADPKTFHCASLFCGVGGLDEGLRLALQASGRIPEKHVDLVGVNHDDQAIIAWKLNFPWGRECREDIAKAQPRQLFPGGRLTLLLAAPSCTHHSVARGGRPVSDQMRSHPWMVVRWARDLDVQTIVVENVPELVNWGPTHVVDCKCGGQPVWHRYKEAWGPCRACKGTGRVEVPIPGKEGTIFRQWLKELRLLGYTLAWKVLNAADYGDATSRRRFFLMAVKGPGPVSWPQQTHSKVNPKTGQPTVPGTKPWRAAREIIDFTLPSQSIFERTKPLAAKTQKRMYDGLEKRNGDWIRPFLVMLRGTGTTREVTEPIPTATAGGNHVGLCEPIILGQQSGAVARGVSTEPLNTVATGGAIGVAEPVVMPVTHVDGSDRTRSLDDPLPTITTAQRGELAVAEPFIMASGGPTSQMQPRDIDKALPTVIGNTRLGIVEPVVLPPDGPGGNGEHNHAKSIDDPLSTVRASRGDRIGLAEPVIVHTTHTKSDGHHATGLSDPLPTVTTAKSGELAVAEPVLVQYNGSSPAQPVADPLPTQPTHDRFGVAEPVLVDMLGSKDDWPARAKSIEGPLPTNHAGAVRWGLAEAAPEPVIVSTDRPETNRSTAHGVDQPLPTVVANNERIGLATPFVVEPVLVPNFGERDGQAPRFHPLDEPLPTTTSHGAGGLVEAVLGPGEKRVSWVRGRPCINGWILDIKFRMLQPRELAASMGFPPTFNFSPIKREAIKQIGNAVAVNMARNLVQAVLEPPTMTLGDFDSPEVATDA